MLSNFYTATHQKTEPAVAKLQPCSTFHEDQQLVNLERGNAVPVVNKKASVNKHG